MVQDERHRARRECFRALATIGGPASFEHRRSHDERLRNRSMVHGILAIQVNLVVSDFDSPDHRAAIWKISGGPVGALPHDLAVHLAEQRHDLPVPAAAGIPDDFRHRRHPAVELSGRDCAHFGERYGGRIVFAVLEPNHLVRGIRETWNTRICVFGLLCDEALVLVTSSS